MKKLNIFMPVFIALLASVSIAAKPGDKKMSNVIIETSMGNIEVELWADKAPITVENFLKYVDKGHYNGLIFHRVIKDFMIQGGGMDKDMKEKSTDKPIKNEAKKENSNARGTLAMARTNAPDSATAQFFINVVDNGFLDPSPGSAGYATFGKVTQGMDVVDKIRKVATATRGHHENVPVEPVVMVSIKRKP